MVVKLQPNGFSGFAGLNSWWCKAGLQLIGLDGAARIVSVSQPVRVSWSGSWDTEPFAVALTPTGAEQRYEVRVLSVQYRDGAR